MNIFVGNFPPETEEGQLREAFEKFGEVSSVQIIRERSTGESRGFAFVEMPTVSDGQEAIKGLDGAEFLGRPLRVNEARPRVQNRPMGGRGRQDSRRHDARRRGGKKRSRKRGSWGF